MSDVSLTVPYEAYLIAETSSAAVETSAVPLAAILSSANTPVGTRQNSIHRVSRILSIRFFISYYLRYVNLIKSGYCDCAFEALETGIVCRLFKHEVQRYILVRGVVNSGEIKGMLVVCLRYFFAVTFYACNLTAKVVVIAVCHLDGVITAVVVLV